MKAFLPDHLQRDEQRLLVKVPHLLQLDHWRLLRSKEELVEFASHAAIFK